jgi:hypothetical protein
MASGAPMRETRLAFRKIPFAAGGDLASHLHGACVRDDGRIFRSDVFKPPS